MKHISMRTGVAATATALAATAILAMSSVAYADTIQDTIADTGTGVTLVAGSGVSGSAAIKLIGNNALQDPDPGCNIDAGESPLVLQVNTPAGVTANPNPLSITSCGSDFPVTFTASAAAVSGHATVTVLSGPAGGGTYVNQVDIPITITQPVPVDAVAPTITHTLTPSGGPNSNGWYNTDVTVTFTCDDAGSGIQSCSGPSTLTEGADQSVTGTAVDKAGNIATDTVSGINVDTTAPSVGFIGGPSGSYYYGSDPAAPTCDPSDATSGIASCVVTGGGTSVGDHFYTATAIDRAGNTATATLNYTVLPWTLKGFTQPVDMNNVWNTVKGGSTVPMKFEAFAGATELTSTSAVKSFTATSVACPGAAAPTDSIELLSTGGTSLRYDTTAGQFIQNWATPKKPGTCAVATLTTQDGSQISANFMLK